MEKPTRNRLGGNGRGFALLYAVMTSSIILAVGVSLISITLKQLSISTLGRESQYAFYAANAGAECALYWDFHGVLKPVAGSTDGEAYQRLAVFANPFLPGFQSEVSDAGDAATVKCADVSLMANIDCVAIDGWCEDTGAAVGQTTFTVFYDEDVSASGPDVNGKCARVTVTKTRGRSVTAGDGSKDFVADATGVNLETTIESRGYNYCDEDNVRRVERGLRFTY